MQQHSKVQGQALVFDLLDHTMPENLQKQITRKTKLDIERFRKCPSAQLLTKP